MSRNYNLTITLPKTVDAMTTPLVIVAHDRCAEEWIEEYKEVSGIEILTRADFQELAAELNHNGFRVDYARPVL